MDHNSNSSFLDYVGVIATAWANRVTGGIVVGTLAFLTISENVLAGIWHWSSAVGTTLGAVTLVWFALSLPLATYQSWKKARDEAADARALATAVAPRIEGRIVNLGWDREMRGQPFFIVAIVSIVNRGADGGIRTLQATAKNMNGEAVTCDVGDPTTAFSILQEDGRWRIYEPEHFLSHSVIVAMRNVPVIGAVFIMFPEISEVDGPTAIDPSSVEVTIYDSHGVASVARTVSSVDLLSPTRIFPGLPIPVKRSRLARWWPHR